jgi:hypothetical protein
MRQKHNPILVGVIAGLAAAILMAVSGAVPFISLILLTAALAAIFIAGLGYGLLSGLVAIATASLANAVLYSAPQSFLFTAIPLLPAAVMSYLANMARPASEIGGPDSALAWFPLSDVLLAGAIVTALATFATLVMHPSMELVYEAVADATARMMQEINPDMPLDPGMRDQTLAVLKLIWPMVQSAQMLIALFAGFYFGMRILAAGGNNIRPREDIPTSLRMNRLSILALAAGILMMLTGNAVLALIGSSLTGAVAGGFLLAGFAVIHNLVRGKSWALPGLILIYLLTLFFLPVIGFLLIIAGGLANPRRAIALTPQKTDETNSIEP